VGRPASHPRVDFLVPLTWTNAEGVSEIMRMWKEEG